MKYLLFIGIIVVVISWLNRSQLTYIERTTGIVFPLASQIDVFDNTEHYVVAHIRLQETDITPFANKYNFDTTPVDITPVDITHWIDTLKLENRVIPTNADLRYLEGRSKRNHWLFALDQNSGRLWVVVFYPDPGGTPP